MSQKGGNKRQKKQQKKQQKQQRKQKKQKKNNSEKKSNNDRSEKEEGIFSHLLKEKVLPKIKVNQDLVHPSMVRLGVQFFHKRIIGSNGRPIALLNAIKDVINDYSIPTGKYLRKDLQEKLNPMIDYIDKCREMSISMRNSVAFVKQAISKVSPGEPEDEAKRNLIEAIDNFIYSKIEFSHIELVKHATERIKDGDTILTYGHSHVIAKIIESAYKKKKFSLIIVNSRPLNEGEKFLKKISELGIECKYVMINAISQMMKKASFVLIGAHSCLSNGYVIARAGTSMIAMTANYYKVPVLFCCETYKFSEKVQLSSVTNNELGDPRQLIKEQNSQDLLSNKKLTIVNLVYDLTPIVYVNGIITEVGIIPPTSVVVIVREANKEMLMNK